MSNFYLNQQLKDVNNMINTLRFENLTPDNLHVVHGPVVLVDLHQPNPLDDVHPGVDPPEDGVLPVQPLRRGQRNEELRSVRVGPRVGHGQDTRTRVLQFGMYFVFEGLPVYGDPALSRSRRIASLYHKIPNHSVKHCVVVVTPANQFREVSAGLWGVLPV